GDIHNKAESWDGRERRRVDDRRTRERRRSSTDEADDLIVVSGRTWIDGKRRMKVRRAADRVWLSDLILSGAFLKPVEKVPDMIRTVDLCSRARTKVDLRPYLPPQ